MRYISILNRKAFAPNEINASMVLWLLNLSVRKINNRLIERTEINCDSIVFHLNSVVLRHIYSDCCFFFTIGKQR